MSDEEIETRDPVTGWPDGAGYGRPVGDTDEAEDIAWDAFYETQGARCCDCPSCNHYLPEGEYKPESECVMRAAIERIIAARTAPAPDPAGDSGDTDAGAAVERVRAALEAHMLVDTWRRYAADAGAEFAGAVEAKNDAEARAHGGISAAFTTCASELADATGYVWADDEGGDWWTNDDARAARIRDLLAASAPPDEDEGDAGAAVAWDEGYAAAIDDYGTDVPWGGSSTSDYNPYRAALAAAAPATPTPPAAPADPGGRA